MIFCLATVGGRTPAVMNEWTRAAVLGGEGDVDEAGASDVELGDGALAVALLHRARERTHVARR